MTLLSSNVDSWVDQAQPAANHGGGARLRLNGGSGSDERYAFVFFARPFPLGATVLTATLKLRVAGDWSGSRTITASRVTDKWGEGKITWNNRPGVTGLHQGSVVVNGKSDGDEVEIDLSAMLNDVASGSAWFGVRLELSTDTFHALYSSDAPNANRRPKLDVTWTENPLPPTNLVPAGASVVGASKPTVAWRFADKEGHTSQASSQVQISTTDDFTAPEYDSGKQANLDGSWDLSATAYAGVPAGATRFWRVRVWNESDLVSDWSASAEFSRVAKGALAITNPPAPPNNSVEETTPPITWTFTGQVQESVRVTLYRVNADGSLAELWRQPRFVTTDTDLTLPAHAKETGSKVSLLQSGKTYRVKVEVWDTLDRASTAGDLAQVIATRDFTYQRAGTPAAVTSLTATVDRVKVTLAWHRTAQPDYFSVREDGVEILTRIDPLDVAVGGGDYELEWWRADPGVEHTYEVEAVVLDLGKLKHSAGNATAVATTRAGGIWLVDDADPGNALSVLIAGQEQVDLAIGETAETHNLVGSRAPVRITDSIRGLEGSVSGVLLSPGEKDDFVELKGRLVPLRLILSTLNFPVVLGQASVPPRPAPGGRFNVSVEVFQVDEFADVAG